MPPRHQAHRTPPTPTLCHRKWLCSHYTCSLCRCLDYNGVYTPWLVLFLFFAFSQHNSMASSNRKQFQAITGINSQCSTCVDKRPPPLVVMNTLMRLVISCYQHSFNPQFSSNWATLDGSFILHCKNLFRPRTIGCFNFILGTGMKHLKSQWLQVAASWANMVRSGILWFYFI